MIPVLPQKARRVPRLFACIVFLAAALAYSQGSSAKNIKGLNKGPGAPPCVLPTPVIGITPASSCGNGHNGVITIEAGGGTGGYTYTLWDIKLKSSSSQSGSSFTGLATDSFTVTVKDGAGCLSPVDTVVVTRAAPVTVLANANLVSPCGNGADGAIYVARSGGIAPLLCTLTKPDGSKTAPQASGIFNSLAPGAYTVTVTDGAGCTATAGVALAKAGPVSLNPSVTLVSNCGKGSDGSILAGRSGGAAPFQYVLTKPDGSKTAPQESESFNNLAEGTYSITATDKAGCTQHAGSIVVGKAAAFTVTGAPRSDSESSCGTKGTGMIYVKTTGGVWPFVFTLTGPGGHTITQRNNEVFSNLVSGTYSLKVTDTAGCTAVTTGLTVQNAKSAPVIVTANASLVSPCGNGADGTIYVARSGGIAPLLCTLTKPDGGKTAPQASGIFNSLVPGAYTVTVTDGAGCTATAGIALTKAGPVSLNPSVTLVSNCGKGSDGGILAGRSGGAAPFQYVLTKPDGSKTAPQESESFNNLAAGTYSIAATDKAGCTQHSGSIVVGKAAALNIAGTSHADTSSSCSTRAAGAIYTAINGGVWPFLFTLTGPGGFTITQKNNGVFSSLAAGTYSVKVADAAGCSAVSTGIAVQDAKPLPLKATASVIPVSSCGNNADGRIDAKVAGGTAPFQYVLTKPDGSKTAPQAKSLFKNLAIGTYSITVKDKNGCSQILGNINMGKAEPLTIRATPASGTQSSCGTHATGMVYGKATGGNWPLTFTLTKYYDYPGATFIQRNNGVFSNLPSSTYSLKVTDTSGCSAVTANFVIQNASPVPIVINTQALPVSPCHDSNGSIVVNAWLYNPLGYQYPVPALAQFVLTKPDGSTITSPKGVTNYAFKNLSVGANYSVSETDSLGCTVSSGNLVIAKDTFRMRGAVLPYPGIEDSCVTKNGNGEIADFSDTWDNPTFTLIKSDGSTVIQKDGKKWSNPDFHNLASGTYSVKMTDSGGCSYTMGTGIVLKNNRTPFAILPQIDYNGYGGPCHANAFAVISVNTQGYIEPFQMTIKMPDGSIYPILPLESGSYAYWAQKGTYSIMLKDKSGCTGSDTNVVVKPPYPVVMYTVKQPSCITAKDGEIDFSVNGGTGSFSVFLYDTRDKNNILLSATHIYSDSIIKSPKLGSGFYDIIVRDPANCYAQTDSIKLSSPNSCPPLSPGPLAASSKATGNVTGILTVQVLPNPTQTVFTLVVGSTNNEPVEITVTDMYGRAIYHASGAPNRQYSFGETFAAGVYTARVIQGKVVKMVKMAKE